MVAAGKGGWRSEVTGAGATVTGTSVGSEVTGTAVGSDVTGAAWDRK